MSLDLLLRAAVASAVLAAPLSAQSVVRGQIRGTVTDADGMPVIEASVTATDVEAGTSHYTYSDRDGVFDFPFLPPGDYEVRAEAPGRRPLLVRTVRVLPAAVEEVSLALRGASPPVTQVDTLDAATVGRGGFRARSSLWLDRADLERLPDRHRGLPELAALATTHDAALGAEGLPGSFTGIVLDGVPFTPARHPLAAGSELLPTALPRAGLARVGFLGDGGDVEWPDGTGGQVSVSSREARAEPGVDLFAAGTTLPFWGSGHWSGPSVPPLTSLWGGGDAHVPLARDSSRLFVAVEGMQLHTPRMSQVPAWLAERFDGLELPVEGLDGGALASPWTERTRSASGLARLDWSLAPDAAVTTRLSLGTQDKRDARFFSSPLDYGLASRFRGTDLAASSSVWARLGDRLSLELRAGFERSDRDYSGTGLGGASLPSTRLVGSDLGLGPAPGQSGRVTRTSVFGGPTVHFRWDEHWFKGGVFASRPSHDYAWLHRSRGEFFFSTPEDLAAGRGRFVGVDAPAVSRAFSVPRAGAFLQHRWDPVPGIRVTTGVRADREFLPRHRVAADGRWGELTGLRSDAFDHRVDRLGMRLGLHWDLTGTGGSVLRGTLGAYHDAVDPAALHEVIALNGSVGARRVVGGLGSWPAAPGPGDGGDAGSLLALFGPGLEAPRTARASGTLSQRLGGATTLHLTGTYRRTTFLLRRVDLNRPLDAAARTDAGRPVWGSLVREGSIVAAEPGSNRRFAGYDRVWGLTADGWSAYRGATVTLEQRAAPWLDLFASYTYSATEDNLVGAATPDPEARLRPGLGDDGRWAEATSDFEVPHRAAVAVRLNVPLLRGASLTTVYRFRSDRPFTPGYPDGVDVNGDGSGRNDPAYVPDLDAVRELAADWPCLASEIGRVSRRNACRGPGAHLVDLHAAVELFRWRGTAAELFVDGFNLLDVRTGIRDATLLRIDAGGELETDPGTGEISVPVEVNPGFGEVAFPVEWGRMVRFGLRLGVR